MPALEWTATAIADAVRRDAATSVEMTEQALARQLEQQAPWPRPAPGFDV